MKRLVIFLFSSLVFASCSAEQSSPLEGLVGCLMSNLSAAEIERIAYLESLDDPKAKLRDLKLYLRKLAEAHCDPSVQDDLNEHIEEITADVRLRSMADVLERSNKILKKEFSSFSLSEGVVLDCSLPLGDVVQQLNVVLDGQYVIKVSDEYSKLRVTGNKTAKGSKLSLIMMQLSFIYGFEYYVTSTKEVMVVPIRGGLFL